MPCQARKHLIFMFSWEINSVLKFLYKQEKKSPTRLWDTHNTKNKEDWTIMEYSNSPTLRKCNSIVWIGTLKYCIEHQVQSLFSLMKLTTNISLYQMLRRTIDDYVFVWVGVCKHKSMFGGFPK